MKFAEEGDFRSLLFKEAPSVPACLLCDLDAQVCPGNRPASEISSACVTHSPPAKFQARDGAPLRFALNRFQDRPARPFGPASTGTMTFRRRNENERTPHMANALGY